MTEVERIRSEAKVASYPGSATDHLKLLQAKDVESFAASSYVSRSGLGKYSRDLVLAWVPPEHFVDAIKPLNAKQLAVVGRALDSRYEGNRTALKAEKGWLDKVAVLMRPLVQARSTMSDFYKHVLRERIITARGKLPD